MKCDDQCEVTHTPYTARELVKFSNALYNEETAILYADTPDADYCLFFKLLLGEVSGRTITDSNENALYVGGYAIQGESYTTIAFVSKTATATTSMLSTLVMTPARIASWLNRNCRGVGIILGIKT
jgi:hypothetical protein